MTNEKLELWPDMPAPPVPPVTKSTINNPFIPLYFQAYVDKAMTYRLPSADAEYAVINLSAEVGELQSLLAKRRRDGPYNDKQMAVFRPAVKKEIGDVLWMLEAVARDNGTSLEECALLNLVKLAHREAKGTLQGSGDNR